MAAALGTDTHTDTVGDLPRRYGAREESQRAVLDNLADGLIITDGDDRILYVNRLMEMMSGYSAEELVGRIGYEGLTPKANWERMRQRLHERLSGSTEEYEHELTRKDGASTWVRVSATP